MDHHHSAVGFLFCSCVVCEKLKREAEMSGLYLSVSSTVSGEPDRCGAWRDEVRATRTGRRHDDVGADRR